jgi:hypothetical protein
MIPRRRRPPSTTGGIVRGLHRLSTPAPPFSAEARIGADALVPGPRQTLPVVERDNIAICRGPVPGRALDKNRNCRALIGTGHPCTRRPASLGLSSDCRVLRIRLALPHERSNHRSALAMVGSPCRNPC